MRQIIKEYMQSFNKTLNLPGISWWIIDYKVDSNIFYCNETMEEIFSLDSNLKGHSVSETCPIAGDYNNNIKITSNDAHIAKKIFDDYDKLITLENEDYYNIFPYHNKILDKIMHFSSRALVLEKTSNGDVSVLYGIIEDITSLEEQKVELQNALKEISTLKTILPICSYCKQIRDDEGSWEQMEAYISSHLDTKFSHGICPECNEKVRKEAGLNISK